MNVIGHAATIVAAFVVGGTVGTYVGAASAMKSVVGRELGMSKRDVHLANGTVIRFTRLSSSNDPTAVYDAELIDGNWPREELDIIVAANPKAVTGTVLRNGINPAKRLVKVTANE